MLQVLCNFKFCRKKSMEKIIIFQFFLIWKKCKTFLSLISEKCVQHNDSLINLYKMQKYMSLLQNSDKSFNLKHNPIVYFWRIGVDGRQSKIENIFFFN